MFSMMGGMKKIVCFLVWLGGLVAGEPRVVVSLPPYAGIVRELVDAEVELVVPVGANPHVYEPGPKEVDRLRKAAVWFRIGDPAEERMVRACGDMRVVVLGHGCCHEGEDLHVWVDPVRMQEQVEMMASVLMEVFPEKAEDVKVRTERLVQRLAEKDQQLKGLLDKMKGKTVVVSHPALGYFCDRYGLKQLSVEVDGKEPRPRDVARLMSEMEKKQVPVIFTEPQHSDKGARLIGERLGIAVEEIDPYAEKVFEFWDQLAALMVKHYDHLD